MAKSAALEKFESVFPTLVEDVLAHTKKYNFPVEFQEWYKAVSKHGYRTVLWQILTAA